MIDAYARCARDIGSPRGFTSAVSAAITGRTPIPIVSAPSAHKPYVNMRFLNCWVAIAQASE